MFKGYKIRLELNDKQRTLALKHAGVARHAYNWAVELTTVAFDNHEKILGSIDLHKLLVKDVKSEYAWYYDSSKCAPQQALRNITTAWVRFFKELKDGTISNKRKAYIRERKRKGLPIKESKLNSIGKPNFKKKGVNDNFYLEGAIITKGNKIKVPAFGWIKMSENIGEQKIKNVSISRTADHWFVAFKVEAEKCYTNKTKEVVGVDLGIKTLAVLSDGTTFYAVKAYHRNKRKLAMAQRAVSRRFVREAKAQSKNYKKAAKKVADLHYKIANIRMNATHQLTTYLAKNHSVIGIEDLNVSGMAKNHKLASAILDGGFAEFRRQLEYKVEWYGSKLIIADTFYPSSKLCSCCSNVKADLKLSDRTYNCDSCGISIDRDLNAAINLRKLAESYSVTLACGEAKTICSADSLGETGMKQQV